LFFAIVALGIIATLISGFYKQILSHGIGVSIVDYGFPFSWYKESWIVYPAMLVVSSYCLECFVLDTIFWSLMITILVTPIIRRKKKV